MLVAASHPSSRAAKSEEHKEKAECDLPPDRGGRGSGAAAAIAIAVTTVAAPNAHVFHFRTVDLLCDRAHRHVVEYLVLLAVELLGLEDFRPEHTELVVGHEPDLGGISAEGFSEAHGKLGRPKRGWRSRTDMSSP